MRATLILSDLSEGSLGEIESVGERENVDRQTMREGERESESGREGETEWKLDNYIRIKTVYSYYYLIIALLVV